MKKHIPSIKQLNELCQKKNYRTQGNWMVRTFLRDWAVPCTWLCLRMGVTANQVTAFSILIALLGAFLISAENSTAFLWGMILVQFWYYLDHVDGQIARFHGAASLTGRFFDFVMHHFVHGVAYFGAGLYLFQISKNTACIYLAGLSSISIMVFNLLKDAKYKTFFEHMLKGSGETWHVVQADTPIQVSAEAPNLSALKRSFSVLHKLNEIHVAMNILTACAIPSLFGLVIFRDVAVWFFALTPPMLVIVKLFYIIRGKRIDYEFDAVFSNKVERG